MPWPFWLMKASIATADLPVWRSPMISSRWPRPTGTSASMALRPVCIGSLTDWNVDDGAGALDGVAFLDLGVRAEDHDADIVGLEVERHALHAVGELDHLAGLDVVEAVDARDTVTDR